MLLYTFLWMQLYEGRGAFSTAGRSYLLLCNGMSSGKANKH